MYLFKKIELNSYVRKSLPKLESYYYNILFRALHNRNLEFSMAGVIKDGDFLYWSMPDPMVTFIGLKNQTFPLGAFFRNQWQWPEWPMTGYRLQVT